MPKEFKEQSKNGMPEPESMEEFIQKQMADIENNAVISAKELMNLSEPERVHYLALQGEVVKTLQQTLKHVLDAIYAQQQLQILYCEALDKHLKGEKVSPLELVTSQKTKEVLKGI